MKLTIKLNTDDIKVTQLTDGVEIEFDEKETKRDLWKAGVYLWLEDSNDNLKDYKSFNVSNKDKMINFKGRNK